MKGLESGSEPIVLSRVQPADFPQIWYEIADEEHFWCRWRLRAFLGQLDALGLPRDRDWQGIEIGCGNGLVRRQLEAATRWRVDGADIDLEALRENRTRRGHSYLYDVHERRADMRQAYDFVVLFDVLEHIEDAEVPAFLGSCLHHLKPGGYLFVNVPAMESLRSRYDEIAGHHRRYAKPDLRAELEQAGLTVTELRYWGLSLIPAGLLRKWLVRHQADADRIITTGFAVPSRPVNAALGLLGRLESRLLSHPPRGTSLLAAARKAPATGDPGASAGPDA